MPGNSSVAKSAAHAKLLRGRSHSGAAPKSVLTRPRSAGMNAKAIEDKPLPSPKKSAGGDATAAMGRLLAMAGSQKRKAVPSADILAGIGWVHGRSTCPLEEDCEKG